MSRCLSPFARARMRERAHAKRINKSVNAMAVRTAREKDGVMAKILWEIKGRRILKLLGSRVKRAARDIKKKKRTKAKGRRGD